MKPPVNVPQSGPADMRVDLGCADAGMAEQFLDDAQIRPMLQQMGGEAVSQHVRGHVSFNARPADAIFDAFPQGDVCKRGTALG